MSHEEQLSQIKADLLETLHHQREIRRRQKWLMAVLIVGLVANLITMAMNVKGYCSKASHRAQGGDLNGPLSNPER